MAPGLKSDIANLISVSILPVSAKKRELIEGLILINFGDSLEGKICLVGVYRDPSGMGDWEDVSTSAGWKESIIKKIQQELMK